MQLTLHFSLAEFTKSQTAERKGISNEPGPVETSKLRDLCTDVLEPIRTLVGGPLSISSGFRSKKLNTAVGGNSKSQHCSGEAADFECKGFDNLTLAKKIIASSIPFDQFILEAYHPRDPNSGWIHISYRKGNNRKQVLTATLINGKMSYSDGLPK